MTANTHHFDALIATAGRELDRAHRGALSVEAGEIRRGLELALAALRDAGNMTPRPPGLDTANLTILADLTTALSTALTDLDTGQLSGMEAGIEAARRRLEALSSGGFTSAG